MFCYMLAPHIKKLETYFWNFARCANQSKTLFFNRQMLVEKNEMHEYETRLPFALITPRHDASTDLIKCPFYVNCDRSSKNKTSSFLCYIPMVSTIPEDLVFKKSIMLAIDDS